MVSTFLLLISAPAAESTFALFACLRRSPRCRFTTTRAPTTGTATGTATGTSSSTTNSGTGTSSSTTDSSSGTEQEFQQ